MLLCMSSSSAARRRYHISKSVVVKQLPIMYHSTVSRSAEERMERATNSWRFATLDTCKQTKDERRTVKAMRTAGRLFGDTIVYFA